LIATRFSPLFRNSVVAYRKAAVGVAVSVVVHFT
jgi:hypothetical protein